VRADIPRLVLVTDRRATAGRDLVETIARALDAGLPAVQLREKDLPGRELCTLAERLRVATRRTNALLFVNDRVDVAVAVEADGVHVGAAGLPVAVVRRLAPGYLVGASTHASDEVAATEADFVFFGPVHATPGKAAYGAPQGLARLADAVARARVPVVAIGGMDADAAPDLRRAGAHGVAVVRAILAAADPAEATRRLLVAVR
jgi:thiamine-phosphate pyrophosphorylase